MKWPCHCLYFAVILWLITTGVEKSVQAQVWEEWAARYGGSAIGEDQSKAIDMSAEGPIFVTGFSTESGSSRDLATIMYQPDGSQAWVALYDGPGHGDDEANDIIVDEMLDDGSDEYMYIYVTGFSTGSGTAKDIITLKYNTSGQQLWAQRYDGPVHGDDAASAIAADWQGNVYVTGYSSGGGSSWDLTTIKYSQAGAELWVARYNGVSNAADVANAIAVDDTGNVYVAGYSSTLLNQDLLVIKYDPSGQQQWVALYSGGTYEESEVANALCLDNAGNILAGGFTGSVTESDYLIVKFDPAGRLLWEAFSFADTAGCIYDMGVDDAGNVYVTGIFEGSSTSYSVTEKYSPAGLRLWQEVYESPMNDLAGTYGLALDSQANVYITGSTYQAASGEDYLTIKYNTSGVMQWLITYAGPASGTDCVLDLVISPYQDVVITGRSMGSGTNYDYATVLYSQAGPPTPVVLAEFYAVPAENGVELTWQTAAEINCYGWQVQRASQALNYQDISPFIPGFGSSQEPHDYSFSDQTIEPGLSYNYRLKQIDLEGSITFSPPVDVAVPALAAEFRLVGAHPNPFNPTTTISYKLQAASCVSLKVYDAAGSLVAELVGGRREVGSHEITFDGSGLPSGVYYYRLTAGTDVASGKMVLMK